MFFSDRKNFTKASGCGDFACCVAVAIDKEDGMVGVCDTKDDSKQPLIFDKDEWKSFVSEVKSGIYDVE